MNDNAIKVRLNGIDLVWLKNNDGSGALAYPSHLDEEGNVTWEHAFTSDSYAHVFSDGTIRRYGQKIGTVKDLEGIVHINHLKQIEE